MTDLAFARYIHLIASINYEPERVIRTPPKRINKLTDEQKAAAIAECAAGAKVKSVAMKYGIHPDNLSKMRRAAGAQRLRRTYTPETIEQARAKHREGKGHRAIAKEMGIPRPTVQAWLRGI